MASRAAASFSKATRPLPTSKGAIMCAAVEPGGSTRSAATAPPPESASPAIADGLATAVTAVYAAAETAILAAITLHVRAALSAVSPGVALQGRSAPVQLEVRRIIARAEPTARVALERTLQTAFARGRGRAAEKGRLEQAMRSVLEQLSSLRYGVIRWATQLWNRLIGVGSGFSGDPLKTADRILQQAAARGITGYIDARGRNWALTSYVDQTVQHAAGGASIDGFTDRLTADGDDLVIVTESPHPCPLCDPWEHRILSVSGADPKRPSMAQARGEGLFHPNCHHTIHRWYPGFVWPPHSLTNQPGTYEATQRQRDIERHIREWKRRQAAALDDLTKAKAGAKVRAWQAELRKHLADEHLTRSRQRERTDYGHTGPLKHAHG